jgi:hypothetical protein
MYHGTCLSFLASVVLHDKLLKISGPADLEQGGFFERALVRKVWIILYLIVYFW